MQLHEGSKVQWKGTQVGNCWESLPSLYAWQVRSITSVSQRLHGVIWMVVAFEHESSLWVSKQYFLVWFVLWDDNISPSLMVTVTVLSTDSPKNIICWSTVQIGCASWYQHVHLLIILTLWVLVAREIQGEAMAKFGEHSLVLLAGWWVCPWVSNMEWSKELYLCQVGDLCSDGGLVPTQFSSGILCIFPSLVSRINFPQGRMHKCSRAVLPGKNYLWDSAMKR